MLRLIIPLTLAAGPALAACPDAPVEGASIVLTREAPYFAVALSPDGVGLRESRVMEESGQLLPVSTIYPHPLVAGARLTSRGVLRLDYDRSPALIDALDEDGSWSSTVSLSIDGTEAGGGQSTLSYLGEATLSVGACSYDVWVVEDRLELQGRDPIVARRFYSPDLRVVLRAVSYGADGEPVSEVRFDRIETAEGL